MKVNELLEGASYNQIGFNLEKGWTVGGLKGYLKYMGADKEDLKIAYDEAKNSPEYESVHKFVTHDSSPKEEANGTFAFETADPSVRYYVYANGQIRRSSHNVEADRTFQTRLKSPIPRAYDPGTTVEGLTNNYRRAFAELAKKLEKIEQKKYLKKFETNESLEEQKINPNLFYIVDDNFEIVDDMPVFDTKSAALAAVRDTHLDYEVVKGSALL